MTPWIKWLARTGLAGVCLAGVGCGGGDVPDPASDSSAAAEGAHSAADAPPQTDAPAPEPAPAPPAAVAQAGRPGMPPGMPGMRPGGPGGPGAPRGPGAPGGPPGAEDDAAEAEPSAAEPSPAVDAAKAAGGSSTAEMLAIATGTQSPPGSDAAPAGPGGPGGPGGGPGGPGGPGGMMPMRPPSMGGNSGSPYSGGGGQMEQMARMQQNQQPGGGQQAQQMASMMQNQMRNQSMRPPGAAGPGGIADGAPRVPGAGMMPGGPGGRFGGPGGADTGPADTQSAAGAVRAFLNALQAKDRDALAEATAQRAAVDSPLETTSTHKDVFGKILDGSISDAELDALAKQFEGLRVAGENAVKSTGRMGIYADKAGDNGATYRRTFTVRKEKKGWGVMDYTGQTKFDGGRATNRRSR